jgi:hypothetical protein
MQRQQRSLGCSSLNKADAMRLWTQLLQLLAAAALSSEPACQYQYQTSTPLGSTTVAHQQRGLLLGYNSAPVLQRQHSAILWQLQYFSNSGISDPSTRT